MRRAVRALFWLNVVDATNLRGFTVFKTNHQTRNLRVALLAGAATATVFAFVGPANAQEAQGATETVIVTGSRIPQVGLVSASPVTVVGQGEVKLEGTTNIENLLNNLPSVTPDFGANESNGTVGTASVDLRSLGSSRTLVLIDGKRMMPGDPELPVADLNQIPAPLVERVEVVTGGASAVYGSDAVAGVVNFIMRKDFEGIEFDSQYSVYQHDNNNSFDRGVVAAGLGGANPGSIALAPNSVTDGGTLSGTVIIGANSDNGKANVTFYVGHQHTDAVLESQRDVSACGSYSTFLYGTGGYICAGSSTSSLNGAGGRFNAITAGFSIGPSKTIDGLTGGLRRFKGGDKFNFAPLNYLQRPDDRYTAGAFAHYEVNKAIDFYGSLMFMDDHTRAQIAPSGLFYGTLAHTNCDNPLLTAGEVATFCTAAGWGPHDVNNMFIGRRDVEGGPRFDDLRHTSYRLVFGAKGDLGDSWTYDLFAQYGETVLSEEYFNDLSLTHIARALLVKINPATGLPACESFIDGSDPNCRPWNIWVPNGVTQEAVNYISTPGIRKGTTQEWVQGGSVAGDLGTLGFVSPFAKDPVAVALGYEYRRERLSNNPDLEFTSGDLAGQGGPTPSTQGGFSVIEGFGEVRIPIVQDAPFAKNLSLNGGYRYSSYSTAGAVRSFKYGAEWQPIDDFRIRASFQRAVRAPNVVELFTPVSLGLFGGEDPCAGASPVLTFTQCARTGVTAAQYGNVPNCPAAQCNALFGGNPTLKAEISDTRELGLVFTPTFIPGFSATVDYFNIRVTGAIGIIPELTTLSLCANGNLTFCPLVHRGIGGALFGVGSTAGFVGANNVNTGAIGTRGIDVEAAYTTDLSDWDMGNNGSLAFNFLGTWTDKFTNQPFPGADIYDCAGLFGTTCGTPFPKWRHKLRTTWASPWDVDVSVQWRYISEVKLDDNIAFFGSQTFCGGPCNDIADGKISAFNYFDLSAVWHVMDSVELRAGVSNIFDKDPPFIDTNNLGISSPPFGNGNTYPQVYDALGRTIFVGATVKL